jgi:hypothetical protein
MPCRKWGADSKWTSKLRETGLIFQLQSCVIFGQEAILIACVRAIISKATSLIGGVPSSIENSSISSRHALRKNASLQIS